MVGDRVFDDFEQLGAAAFGLNAQLMQQLHWETKRSVGERNR